MVNSKAWKIGKEKERVFSFSSGEWSTSKHKESKTGRNVEYRLAREERQSTKAQGPLSLFKKKNADANK